MLKVFHLDLVVALLFLGRCLVFVLQTVDFARNLKRLLDEATSFIGIRCHAGRSIFENRRITTVQRLPVFLEDFLGLGDALSVGVVLLCQSHYCQALEFHDERLNSRSSMALRSFWVQFWRRGATVTACLARVVLVRERG